MKDKKGNTIGILLIAVGIIVAGRVLGWFSFSVFFRGWWTLFIIIPSAVSLLSEKGQRISALRGLLIGLLLFLMAQGFIKVTMFFPLVIAVLMVMFGLRLISPKSNRKNNWENNWNDDRFGNDNSYSKDGFNRYNHYEGNNVGPRDAFHGKESMYDPFKDDFYNNEGLEEYHFTPEEDLNSASKEDFGFGSKADFGFEKPEEQFAWNNYGDRGGYYRSEKTGRCACTALFSGKQIRYDFQEFRGAALSAIFGGIDLDLTNAYFENQVEVVISAVFGGVNLIVPPDVRVEVAGSSIFGGVDIKKLKRNTVPPTRTIYLRANCIFGGVDVRTAKG